MKGSTFLKEQVLFQINATSCFIFQPHNNIKLLYPVYPIIPPPQKKKFVKEKKMEFSMFDFETFLQFEIKGGLKLLIGSNENSLLA